MNPILAEQVTMLMRAVAKDIVLPRFQQLASEDIAEKAPGDIVTIVDHASEERIAEGLTKLLPEARIVGEEGAAENPELLETLDRGMIWLIDPLDGTSNFAEGRAPFALMIALLADSEAQAGWIFDPLTPRICYAARGQGAYLNGERIASHTSPHSQPLAALGLHFMDEDRQQAFANRADGTLTIVPIPRCAGEQYPRVALGQNDIALFAKSYPYDHAAGVLFLEEAGGKTAWPDGDAYSVARRDPDLLSAATPELWDWAAEILFG
ncbi:inositol monophosphatase [Parasphingopyxis sp.]|uniref:inositol monophosphatase family protein n=1 Tax=Parasphingopyxis sp. TaxID=1920299 RepID=UPI002631D28D|nr:inositol monophosphatase [Parasphingopyxis sp.]